MRIPKSASAAWLVSPLLLLFACSSSKSGPSSIDEVAVTEQLALPGLSESVDIIRDEHYRPHIYAKNDADLFFAAGYVQAADRWVEMDFLRRFGDGTIAEIVGPFMPDLIENDFKMRVLGIREVADEMFNSLPEDSSARAHLINFANGANAWVARLKAGEEELPYEYNRSGYPASETREWAPADALVIGRMQALNLAWTGDYEIQLGALIESIEKTYDLNDPRRGLICDAILQFTPAAAGSIANPDAAITRSAGCPWTQMTVSRHVQPEQIRALTRFTDQTLRHPLNVLYVEDRGSNNWAVSGNLTQSGHPILANDPHLLLSMPSLWYEIHLNSKRAGGTIDAEGVTLPGNPVPTIGHNGQVAWGITNVGPDVTDTFVEQISKGTGADGVDQVWFEGQWLDLVGRDEKLWLRDGGGVLQEETRTVWSHPTQKRVLIPDTLVEFPLSSGNWTALSWRWTGMEASDELLSLSGMTTVANSAEVRDAMSHFGAPPLHFVFVTDEGDIGWDANGLYPLREDDDANAHTDPPFLPLPGDGSHDWTGFVASENMPRENNPERGWIQSANQDPTGGTLDGDPTNDAVYLGADFAIGFRGERISNLLREKSVLGKMTVEDMMEIQADHRSPMGARLTPALLKSIGAKPSYAGIADLLQGWTDRGYWAESGVGAVPVEEKMDAAATSIFNAWLVYVTRLAFKDDLETAGISIGSSGSLTDAYDFDTWLGSDSLARMLLLIVENPTMAATYDSVRGDSVLWDDTSTPDKIETRDEIFQWALDQATVWVSGAAGFGSSNPLDWTWGSKHTVRLSHLSGVDLLSVPPSTSSEFPNGFPHHGDNWNVDAGNPGISSLNFSYISGPSMRMVVDATPDQFQMYLSFPGGVSGNLKSDYYSDRALSYMANEYQNFWFHEPQVAAAATQRLVLEPAAK